MKRLVIGSMIMCCSFMAGAQNWQEWTQQKKTQIAYLVNQVAALQVYIDLGQKGYSIYRDGLDLIGDIKDGEFNLHKNYFASLSGVNTLVSGAPKVAEMLLFNELVQLLRHRVAQLELGEYSTSIRHLFDQLSKKSSDHVPQMKLLISPGNYQLKDEERMKRIDRLYKEISKLYGLAKRTYQEAVLQRKVLTKQEKEIDILEHLHGLK